MGVIQEIEIIRVQPARKLQARPIGLFQLFFLVITVRIAKRKNRLNKQPRSDQCGDRQRQVKRARRVRSCFSLLHHDHDGHHAGHRGQQHQQKQHHAGLVLRLRPRAGLLGIESLTQPPGQRQINRHAHTPAQQTAKLPDQRQRQGGGGQAGHQPIKQALRAGSFGKMLMHNADCGRSPRPHRTIIRAQIRPTARPPCPPRKSGKKCTLPAGALFTR